MKIAALQALSADRGTKNTSVKRGTAVPVVVILKFWLQEGGAPNEENIRAKKGLVDKRGCRLLKARYGGGYKLLQVPEDQIGLVHYNGDLDLPTCYLRCRSGMSSLLKIQSPDESQDRKIKHEGRSGLEWKQWLTFICYPAPSQIRLALSKVKMAY